MPALAICLFAVPFAEIFLLIKVGQLIGAVPTLGLVVLSAVLGAWLLHRQGLAAFERARTLLAQGQLPAAEMLQGFVLILGGVLLITPGFITDTLGLVCLVPAVRQALIRRFARFVVAAETRTGARDGHRIIDGEFRVERE